MPAKRELSGIVESARSWPSCHFRSPVQVRQQSLQVHPPLLLPHAIRVLLNTRGLVKPRALSSDGLPVAAAVVGSWKGKEKDELRFGCGGGYLR